MILVFDLRVPNLWEILNPQENFPGNYLTCICIYLRVFVIYSRINQIEGVCNLRPPNPAHPHAEHERAQRLRRSQVKSMVGPEGTCKDMRKFGKSHLKFAKLPVVWAMNLSMNQGIFLRGWFWFSNLTRVCNLSKILDPQENSSGNFLIYIYVDIRRRNK